MRYVRTHARPYGWRVSRSNVPPAPVQCGLSVQKKPSNDFDSTRPKAVTWQWRSSCWAVAPSQVRNELGGDATTIPSARQITTCIRSANDGLPTCGPNLNRMVVTWTDSPLRMASTASLQRDQHPARTILRIDGQQAAALRIRTEHKKKVHVLYPCIWVTTDPAAKRQHRLGAKVNNHSRL
jgi:hypothetical protein